MKHFLEQDRFNRGRWRILAEDGRIVHEGSAPSEAQAVFDANSQIAGLVDTGNMTRSDQDNYESACAARALRGEKIQAPFTRTVEQKVEHNQMLTWPMAVEWKKP